MDSADRQPCPHCGEPTPEFATACPFCKASLVVDVVLPAPVDDERIRYQLARAIAALGPPAPDFSTALDSLASPRPLLARGISRLAARRFVESLADFGFAGVVEPAGTTAPARKQVPHRLALAAALAVAAIGALAVALLFATHNAPSGPGGTARLSTGLAKARALPWPSPNPALTGKDLLALAAPATVEVRCGDLRSTGFFVARDTVLAGLPATSGCAPIKVATRSGKILDGAVTRQDSWLGRVLIAVAGSGAEPLRIGDASTIHGGDRVLILGGFGTGEETLHEARRRAAGRRFHGIAHLALEGDVPADAAGGPVLDDHGYVVGLMEPPGETGGEPFFLPINYTYEEAHLLERPVPSPDPRKWKALLAEVELAEKIESLRFEPSQTPGAAPPPEPSPSIQ